jgi:hydrogenase nickel incorporation protein HypA/HybF
MNIVDIVTKEVESRHLQPIDEICVRVGTLSGVDPDALEFAFTIAAQETILNGATLAIERILVAAICRKCGSTNCCENHTYVCMQCGSTELEITQGEELEIAYLVEKD